MSQAGLLGEMRWHAAGEETMAVSGTVDSSDVCWGQIQLIGSPKGMPTTGRWWVSAIPWVRD